MPIARLCMQQSSPVTINHTAMLAASWSWDTRFVWPTWSDPPKADVKRSSQRKMSRDILGFHKFSGYIWHGFAELPCSRPRATNHSPPPYGSPTAAGRMSVGGRGHLEVPIWWVGERSGRAVKMPLIPCIDCCSTETVCSSYPVGMVPILAFCLWNLCR